MMRQTARAVRANLRGFPNESRYSTASFVASSDFHHISMSLPDTSSLSPRETKEEIPMPSRDKCSSRTMPTPPDCSARRPSRPRMMDRERCVQMRGRVGHAETVGPTSRMPWRRQMPSNSVLAAPSKPDVVTTRALTPRRPHSSAIATTAVSGAAMTARSTGSGSAVTDGAQGMPSSSAALGLTA